MNHTLCKMSKTRIRRTATEAGQSIEEQLRKIIAEKQPIPNVLPEIYTEKKDGVRPDTDVRTDRFNIAMQAQDKYARSKIAKGEMTPTEEKGNSETTEDKTNNVNEQKTD